MEGENIIISMVLLKENQVQMCFRGKYVEIKVEMEDKVCLENCSHIPTKNSRTDR